MIKKIFILLFLMFVFTHLQSADPTGQITIVVNGFENDNGKARILIFSSNGEDAFPSEHKKSYKKIIVPIEKNKVIYTFENIPYDVYAISVHHDEDGDGEVGTNWLGIPNEGLGASNDAKGTFGPPSFEDASFRLNNKKIRLNINMVY